MISNSPGLTSHQSSQPRRKSNGNHVKTAKAEDGMIEQQWRSCTSRVEINAENVGGLADV